MTTFGPYPATVVKVHDGDTVRFDLDQGFGTHQTAMSCRVDGINSPELSTPEGKTAAAFAQSLLPVGTAVSVVSHGWDKYGGRYLGSITLPDGTDFATAMIAAGHAKPYNGEGPKPV